MEAAARERAERRSCIERCLAMIWATYDREPPEGHELSIKVAAWVAALGEVPVGEIEPLVAAELRRRTSQYPPKPADILRRWHGDEWSEFNDEEGRRRRERVTVANASAYSPLVPTANAVALKNALEQADGPGRAEWMALRDALRPAPSKAVQTRTAPHNEHSLLAALCEYTDMQPWLLPREEWTTFGWWMLSRYKVDEWNGELARGVWDEWVSGEAQGASCLGKRN